MKTDLLSINKIFTDRIFRIPDYQRGYAWREKQLKDYWNDLVQLEDGKNHYVGVLTFEDVSKDKFSKWDEDLWIIEGKCFTPLFVVDGQQRLTTSIILIQSIVEYNKDNKKINYSSNEEIIKRYIFESKDEGISKSYIFGYDKDNPSYEYLKTKIYLELSDNNLIAEDTIYTHNLEKAKKYFKEQLDSLEFDEVEVIFKKITQHYLFNIYSVSSDIDVNVAFEGMNNRGKPLSILEILKNRLILLSTKVEGYTHDKVKLRHSINEAWKTIYHHLGRNKDNPLDDDIFLLNHFYYYFGNLIFQDDEVRYKFIHRRLASDYKEYLLDNLFSIKYLHGENIEHSRFLHKELDASLIYGYVASLKTSVETWFNLLNPDNSKFCNDEKKLLNSIHRITRNSEGNNFMVLVLVFFEKVTDSKSRVALLQIIEKMLFFNTLTSHRYYSSINDMNDEKLLELAMELANGKKNKNNILNDLSEIWSIRVSDKRLIVEVVNYFKSRGFYHWSGLKYFLYEYEEYLLSASKTSRHKLIWSEFITENENDYSSIEHIYPQTARKKCWSTKFKKYNQAQRYALKDSLGNLLPLSKAKNSSLGNRCFSEKKCNTTSTAGYSYGSYSEIEVSLTEDWGALEILNRGIRLTHFFEQRWGIKFSSNQQIMDFLGVGFLSKTDEKIVKEIDFNQSL